MSLPSKRKYILSIMNQKNNLDSKLHNEEFKYLNQFRMKYKYVYQIKITSVDDHGYPLYIYQYYINKDKANQKYDETRSSGRRVKRSKVSTNLVNDNHILRHFVYNKVIVDV